MPAGPLPRCRRERPPKVLPSSSFMPCEEAGARGICRKAREIAVDKRAAPAQEFRQTRELRESDPCVHIGQIEFAAGKGDVTRAVGKALDAVEPQPLDAPRFRRVVDDQRAALD